jgi:hypothetical protein
MKELKLYLISTVELSENYLNTKINAHFDILDKMDRKNKKKTEAAVNEDFELAAKYRN